MKHWEALVAAYGLTFLALTVEVLLLVRRRRAALRQARLLVAGSDPAETEQPGGKHPGSGHTAGT